MALSDDLMKDVKNIFATSWKVRDGQKVPEPEDVNLGNDAIKIDGTVLYADLAESTVLVDNYSRAFAAEIYKSYLHCASKIIAYEGGAITAFDGDRVMAVFIGGRRNPTAARCALKINHAVQQFINPAIKVQYPESTYALRHAIGIDTSELLVARTGIRGSNDLVWVGRAANYAAKLCSLRDTNSIWITDEVYQNLDESTWYGKNGTVMWASKTWEDKRLKVYGSSWIWEP